MKKTMIKLGLALAMTITFGVIGTTTVQAEENIDLIATSNKVIADLAKETKIENQTEIGTGAFNIFESAINGDMEKLDNSLNAFERINNEIVKASDKLVAFVNSDDFKIDTTNFKTAVASAKDKVSKIFKISGESKAMTELTKQGTQENVSNQMVDTSTKGQLLDIAKTGLRSIVGLFLVIISYRILKGLAAMNSAKDVSSISFAKKQRLHKKMYGTRKI
ncbi:hypothetical protein [Vagococcus fluvialis]|uniref:hypothetical protein n=1 Tax=Vagococcus fluvialis TaxID=2738 RepID=UPI001D0A88D1|nr:hypothetical protein [Vagococcus fluvialis]UDM84086.1 hypothetical protein K5K96_15180 [Vagococcus fluvialis]